ncbi:MAG: hypothetical protein M1143_02295 [Candidatus Thermoplasmatota archaeon]|nr:hypothetical protein [Candidatus Thermoplasmatota archaeon]
MRLRDLPEEKLDRLFRALGPETGDVAGKSTVALEREPGGVLLQVRADTSSALRASLNAYLKWVIMVDAVESLAETVATGAASPKP